ncbi:MAG: xanthine dehydrogenase family protein subunit M [Anaerolineales bacterium]|nr:xanthine dehydrogenase family protein subunit M [Anaerolineales bacterium]
MKPAPFQYLAPTTVEEAQGYLAEYGYEAKVLAGGQSLVPLMNFRLAQPSVLIDMNHVSDLFYIQQENGAGLRVGAMTRQAQLEREALVAQRAPLVREALPKVAYPQVRSRGTMGGSIAHADPSAELPAVCVALDAQFKLSSRNGERWMAAQDFFQGLFATALEPDELLVEIQLPPMPPRSGCSILEVSRRHHDFAMAGVAALATLDSVGKCQGIRMVFFSVGDKPMLARNAATVLQGQVPEIEAIRTAAKVAAREDIDPGSDIHATADYRRHLARVLAERVLTEALNRAGGD